MKIFTSFVAVGLICAIASLIYDLTKLTSGHITSLFVVVGAVLGMFGFYDVLIDKFGYGLTLPITSFGNSLVKSSYNGFLNHGVLGIFTEMYKSTSAGISMTIIGSFIVSLVCRPRD